MDSLSREPIEPSSTPVKKDGVETRIGKGYSYLFAIALTILLTSQSISIQFKTDKLGNFDFSIASKEINPQTLYPCIGLIASILGLPTDAIALALGKLLTKEVK